MEATKPKLELVSAKVTDVCKICTGLGYYQIPEGKERSGELQLCECVNDLCKSCDNNKYDKTNRIIYNAATNQKTHCRCMPFSVKFNQIKKLYDKSNIPSRYKNASLELKTDHDTGNSLELNIPDIKRYLSDFDATSKRGFYFQGKTGSGKTHVACAILNNLILTRGIEGRYCHVSQDLFNPIKDSYEGIVGLRTARQIENEYQEVPILVIDDLGVQKDTLWALEILYNLIDTRYSKEKVTIITSNKPMEYWEGVFENRIHSRLVEMCEQKFFESPDYRKYIAGAA